jgi:hypothetical protein
MTGALAPFSYLVSNIGECWLEKVFNRMTGALAPFSYLVSNIGECWLEQVSIF